ncbi:hypothetical protein JB92DRAFT_3112889 [Gautieria morchelliformis]|nr:hypothetical protein JB92DRAFT_3112889 [Gautieria morchelliformis]
MDVIQLELVFLGTGQECLNVVSPQVAIKQKALKASSSTAVSAPTVRKSKRQDIPPQVIHVPHLLLDSRGVFPRGMHHHQWIILLGAYTIINGLST